MSLIARLTGGDGMKLFAQKVLTVKDLGYVHACLDKVGEFRCSYPYTGGTIKYLGLPKGTLIRVTIEVLDKGDDDV